MTKIYLDSYGYPVPNQFYVEETQTYIVKDVEGNIVEDVDFSKMKLKRDPKYGKIIPNQAWDNHIKDFVITDKQSMWLPQDIGEVIFIGGINNDRTKINT